LDVFTTLKELNLNDRRCKPVENDREKQMAHLQIKIETFTLYAPQRKNILFSPDRVLNPVRAGRNKNENDQTYYR